MLYTLSSLSRAVVQLVAPSIHHLKDSGSIPGHSWNFMEDFPLYSKLKSAINMIISVPRIKETKLSGRFLGFLDPAKGGGNFFFI